jgi:hypothetical protein
LSIARLKIMVNNLRMPYVHADEAACVRDKTGAPFGPRPSAGMTTT